MLERLRKGELSPRSLCKAHVADDRTIFSTINAPKNNGLNLKSLQRHKQDVLN